MLLIAALRHPTTGMCVVLTRGVWTNSTHPLTMHLVAGFPEPITLPPAMPRRSQSEHMSESTPANDRPSHYRDSSVDGRSPSSRRLEAWNDDSFASPFLGGSPVNLDRRAGSPSVELQTSEQVRAMDESAGEERSESNLSSASRSHNQGLRGQATSDDDMATSLHASDPPELDSPESDSQLSDFESQLQVVPSCPHALTPHFSHTVSCPRS